MNTNYRELIMSAGASLLLTGCGGTRWVASDVQYIGKPAVEINVAGFVVSVGLPGQLVLKGEAESAVPVAEGTVEP